MSGPLTSLLAAMPGSRLFSDILPWLVVLVVIVLIGAAVLYYVRRSMSADQSASAGFTLQDLRDLHASGQLSLEEFEQARDAMIGRLNPSKDADEPENDGMMPGNDEKSDSNA